MSWRSREAESWFAVSGTDHDSRERLRAHLETAYGEDREERRIRESYTAVKTKHAVMLYDMDEGAEHASGAIWAPGLKANLLNIGESKILSTLSS